MQPKCSRDAAGVRDDAAEKLPRCAAPRLRLARERPRFVGDPARAAVVSQAVTLAPAKHVDGYYEFWPQDFVVRKGAAEGEAQQVGVVVSVDHDERIAVVSWRLNDAEAARAMLYANAADAADGEGAAAQAEHRGEVVPN